MKKRMKKLRLAKETLRHLSSGDLKAAAGGRTEDPFSSCTDTCVSCEPTDVSCVCTCNCASDYCHVCTQNC
jgi:hypothetical protein